LSEDMANTLAARIGGPAPDTLVINNFSLPAESSVPGELPFSWPDEPFVLLFAGNIGRFQGLDVLIDAMGRLSDRSDIRLVMMGEGMEKDRLSQKSEQIGAKVSFVGHHSVGVAKAAMVRASSGFVSLVPELYRYAYPSKTMTYLEQGCPVLVAVEPESCLAKDIVDSAAGLAVPGSDLDRLVEAISSLADNPGRVNSMRRNAREFAARGFAPDVVLARWSSLLKEPSDV
jgi:glycosyltransferase involved in cell wall biosynthesis